MYNRDGGVKIVRSEQAVGGAGLPGLLFVALVVLKLTDQIAWGWLWVAAPLWAPFALVVSIFLIAIIVYGLIAFIGWARDKWSNNARGLF